MKNQISEKDMKVLKRIQDSIPQELLSQVTKMEDTSSVIYEIIEKALKDPDVTHLVKEKMIMIRDSGLIKKQTEVENKEVTDKIDKYVEEEIKKAVKRGELTKKQWKKQNKNL